MRKYRSWCCEGRRKRVAKVLVTGSAGGVGLGVCRALLAAGHDVTGFDLQPSEPGVHSVIGDITDREVVRNAIAGNDMVIHLAATPDEADFLGELLEPNVRGLFHICDGARTEQIKRLVLASSVQVVSGHSWRQTIQIEDGPRVVNHYALTKLWLESMGEMYAREHRVAFHAGGGAPAPRPHVFVERAGRRGASPRPGLCGNQPVCRVHPTILH